MRRQVAHGVLQRVVERERARAPVHLGPLHPVPLAVRVEVHQQAGASVLHGLARRGHGRAVPGLARAGGLEERVGVAEEGPHAWLSCPEPCLAMCEQC